MIVDEQSRNRLQTMQTAKVISDGLDKLSTTLKSGTGEGGSMVLANEFRALQKILSEEALSKLKNLISELDDKLGKITELEKNLPRNIELNFPTTYPVEGNVEVTKLPSVSVNNLDEIATKIAATVNNLQVATLKAIQASKPNSQVQIGNEVKIADFSDLLDGIEELKKGFNLLINKEVGTIAFPSTVLPVEIQNWKVPQPVTNVSINPSRGEVKATAVTVTTALTPLPGTALFDRRSMTIYNNGSVTVYVGGANVTSATGIPVPAGTYGPSLDAGPRNIVYAVTASSTSDIRVLEMSDTMEGGDA